MTDKPQYPLLDTVNNTEDLRALSPEQLPQLASELRNFLLHSVANTGGHLSSGLGTVELTIALHYVYNTPFDRIIWDVGHQSYPHKILTDRKNAMAGLRQKGGISGFPKRGESEYDAFGTGHSSTSISAALGMAISARLQETKRSTIGIIGDGALTGGMAFEALSHAGSLDTDMLVILNDNDMSISPNVGGMSNYLAKILSGRLYHQMRESGKKVLSVTPTLSEIAKRAEEHVKGMVVPGTLFEELGFNYIGPIDGHDLPTLLETLQNLQELKGPQFLHIVTKKGKGYQPAEENPILFHGVTPFDVESGIIAKTQRTNSPTYTEVFGEWLCDMAEADSRLVAITPAMREGSGMVAYSERFPERYFDVGIAEQHAVTLAAGLACENIKPVVAIYSTFLQRGYDQLIHDIALQNLPVLFAIDRAGLVGADGPTHAGSFDISYLRCIPNMVIMAPADENECRQMLYTGFTYNGPSAIRYPRGTGPGVAVQKIMQKLPLGKADVLRSGHRVVILAFGSMLSPAMAAAEKLDATVVNMRFIKPLDKDMVIKMASLHELVVTVEENVIAGGAGSAINELLVSMASPPNILNLGLPDKFVEHGNHGVLLSNCGLDEAGIISSVKHSLSINSAQALPVSANSK
ncbi:MAG TPA: 1-deoxy-D-xylulose-5-phosphate synthase [Gammaproteobacteria bacterium]|nr:1-deoxy-D-xylulose-5-phosphate synthase [Gammaproteobacteria bacterium]